MRATYEMILRLGCELEKKSSAWVVEDELSLENELYCLRHLAKTINSMTEACENIKKVTTAMPHIPA